MTIRVGVVDDQELVRTGFAMILASEPDLEVAFEAADGRDLGDARRPREAAGRRPDPPVGDLLVAEVALELAGEVGDPRSVDPHGPTPWCRQGAVITTGLGRRRGLAARPPKVRTAW